jgi:cardiolipin synthase A/B
MIDLLINPEGSDGAAPTFDRVIAELRSSQRSVEIHMFVWRDDAIGNTIGTEVLAAADRGVRILIRKDLGAIMYERIEMNRKSFFPTPLPLATRLKHRLMGLTFPKTFVRDEYDGSLGRAVIAHPNVTLEWVKHTHTKYYIFDDRLMLTGSINIEDRHCGYNDYMVALTGEDRIAQFRQQLAPASHRELNFVANRAADFAIKPLILQLLSTARQSVYIEMAYIGDPDVMAAIADSANRGVRVTILFSRKANIGNDINYLALRALYQNAPIEVYLTDTMIHAKLMLFDRETVLLGSANLSVFSMEAAEELDVLIRHTPDFVASLEPEIARRLAAGQCVTTERELRGFNRTLAGLQQLHQRLSQRASRSAAEGVSVA